MATKKQLRGGQEGWPIIKKQAGAIRKRGNAGIHNEVPHKALTFHKERPTLA
jgi:hypothetical protein